MSRPSFNPSLLRRLPRPATAAKISALAAALGAGVLAAGSSAFSATPPSDCLLPPVCPTLPAPTVPGVSLPIPTTTSPSDSPPEPSGAPDSLGGGAAQGAPTSAAAPQGQTALLTYSVQTSASRQGSRRWIHLKVTLSQSATVVAIMHRTEVPVIAAVRTGRLGSNAFAVSVPRRVRRGRYALRLVLATPSARHTLNRRISIPK
jgi:hypothetical protein